VATPLAWEEVVPGLKPSQFHIANVLRRFDRVGDLFAGVLTKPQEMEEALERLSGLVGQK
jgi:DNA primase